MILQWTCNGTTIICTANGVEQVNYIGNFCLPDFTNPKLTISATCLVIFESCRSR